VIAQAWFDTLTRPRGTGAVAMGFMADAFPMLYSGPPSLQPAGLATRQRPPASARR